MEQVLQDSVLVLAGEWAHAVLEWGREEVAVLAVDSVDFQAIIHHTHHIHVLQKKRN